jgi:hypothetical protein
VNLLLQYSKLPVKPASIMRSSLAYQGSSWMIWVLLEVAIALGLAIAIVLWTFPREKKPPHDPERDA